MSVTEVLKKRELESELFINSLLREDGDVQKEVAGWR